jgi:WD40 repeat protein
VAARSCGAADSGDYLVASVDSYGSAVVSRVHVSLRGADDAEVAASAAASSDASFRVLSSSALLPPNRVEDGWHGISLHPLHDDQTCVASHYGKSLSLYSGSQLLQTLYTASAPTSFKWMQAAQFAAPLLVCNEGNTLSVWDVRMSNGVGQTDNISRGAVQRLQDTNGILYALDSHDSGLLATGGVDKQVTVYGESTHTHTHMCAWQPPERERVFISARPACVCTHALVPV